MMNGSQLPPKFRWHKIAEQFESHFQKAFSANKKAHFDNLPEEYRVVDGAKTKWCNLLLLDAIIYIVKHEQFNNSSRRAFNQHRVLYECILDELKMIDLEAYFAIFEDKSRHVDYASYTSSISLREKADKYAYLTLAPLEEPWSTMDMLCETILDAPPSKAKNKYMMIVHLLTQHEDLKHYNCNLHVIIQLVISKVMFVYNTSKVTPSLSLPPSTEGSPRFGEIYNGCSHDTSNETTRSSTPSVGVTAVGTACFVGSSNINKFVKYEGLSSRLQSPPGPIQIMSLDQMAPSSALSSPPVGACSPGGTYRTSPYNSRASSAPGSLKPSPAPGHMSSPSGGGSDKRSPANKHKRVQGVNNTAKKRPSLDKVNCIFPIIENADCLVSPVAKYDAPPQVMHFSQQYSKSAGSSPTFYATHGAGSCSGVGIASGALNPYHKQQHVVTTSHYQQQQLMQMQMQHQQHQDGNSSASFHSRLNQMFTSVGGPPEQQMQQMQQHAKPRSSATPPMAYTARQQAKQRKAHMLATATAQQQQQQQQQHYHQSTFSSVSSSADSSFSSSATAATDHDSSRYSFLAEGNAYEQQEDLLFESGGTGGDFRITDDEFNLLMECTTGDDDGLFDEIGLLGFTESPKRDFGQSEFGVGLSQNGVFQSQQQNHQMNPALEMLEDVPDIVIVDDDNDNDNDGGNNNNDEDEGKGAPTLVPPSPTDKDTNAHSGVASLPMSDSTGELAATLRSLLGDSSSNNQEGQRNSIKSVKQLLASVQADNEAKKTAAVVSPIDRSNSSAHSAQKNAESGYFFVNGVNGGPQPHLQAQPQNTAFGDYQQYSFNIGSFPGGNTAVTHSQQQYYPSQQQQQHLQEYYQQMPQPQPQHMFTHSGAYRTRCESDSVTSSAAVSRRQSPTPVEQRSISVPPGAMMMSTSSTMYDGADSHVSFPLHPTTGYGHGHGTAAGRTRCVSEGAEELDRLTNKFHIHCGPSAIVTPAAASHYAYNTAASGGAHSFTFQPHTQQQLQQLHQTAVDDEDTRLTSICTMTDDDRDGAVSAVREATTLPCCEREREFEDSSSSSSSIVCNKPSPVPVLGAFTFQW